MLPFHLKYTPQELSGIKGQDEAVKAISQGLTEFHRLKKKAFLLYGPPGAGKTCLATAAAQEFNLELVEINASEHRNEEQILSKVGGAIRQQSLFSKGKLILIDDVDGIVGNADRGGLPALVSLLKETSFPIILTCINPWDTKFSALRKQCTLLELPPLQAQTIFLILKEICNREGILADDESLKSLARRSGGDCRAASNDLELLSAGTHCLSQEMLELMGDRDKEETMLKALLKVFKTTDLKIALGAFEHVRGDIDEQFLWVDENLPREYAPAKDIAQGYESLSKADLYKSRISRWQHWRFLVYANAFLSGGVALAKQARKKEFTAYQPTGRLLKYWWAKQKSFKKKAIAERMASQCHMSLKDSVGYIPFFREIFRRNSIMAAYLSEAFSLDSEEQAWLRK